MRATVNGVSTDYAYDTAGNIRSKTGHSYEYDNPQWLDQLTAYDGGEITYDECGNPLEYYNGSTFTWTQGRKLESANVSGTSVSYTYDMAGVRSGKTVGGMSYSFTTLSGLVTRQTWGDSAIDFVYDENNQPLAMRYNGTWYYYVLNLQGDVVKLVRADGAIVASYSYDPWGKVLTSSGSLADVNPLRYRGYYYDTETGFYYLQSRYYDPEIGRFINADSCISGVGGNVLGSNMYAYCLNNPVNMSDENGTWPKLSQIFTAVAVAAVAVAAVAVTVATCGAAAPALAIAGGGLIGGMLAGAATAASVATGAMIVAGVSAAAVTSAAAEKTVEKTAKRNNSVYVLKDDTGTVQYVGRTNDVDRRRAAHSANPARTGLRMEVVASGLSLSEARTLEQAGMAYYHTINTANRMNNQINSIAPKYWGPFMELALGALNYEWNQMTNEILYWTGN